MGAPLAKSASAVIALASAAWKVSSSRLPWHFTAPTAVRRAWWAPGVVMLAASATTGASSGCMLSSRMRYVDSVIGCTVRERAPVAQGADVACTLAC